MSIGKRKTGIVILVALLLLLNSMPIVHAASEIPNAFWGLAPKYQEALDKKDHTDIIKYGWEIIKLFDDKEESQVKLNIVTPRLEKIALAYEALGQYDKAVETFKKYVPMGEKQGWTEGVVFAQSKIRALDFDIDLYTTVDVMDDQEGEENPYEGISYVPESGLYFGNLCRLGKQSF